MKLSAIACSGTVGGQKALILQSQQDELEKEKDFHRPDPPNEMKEVNPTSPPCCSIPQGLPLTGSAVALNPMSWPHACTSQAINPDTVQAVSGFHCRNLGPSACCSVVGLGGIFLLLH